LSQTNFDPRGFLSLAKELAVRTEESALRTAMSRAYYSTYLRHRSAVARHFRIDPEDVKHYSLYEHGNLKAPGVVDQLCLVFKNPMLQQLADSLYQKRIAADYKPTNPAVTRQKSKGQPSVLPITKRTAMDSILEAEKISALTGL
jgi:hypothetical protein